MASAADHYRERAEECFRLARESADAWVRKALENLGFEMLEAADEIEPRRTAMPDRAAMERSGRQRRGDHGHGN